jgi:hypothetical protein
MLDMPLSELAALNLLPEGDGARELPLYVPKGSGNQLVAAPNWSPRILTPRVGASRG